MSTVTDHPGELEQDAHSWPRARGVLEAVLTSSQGQTGLFSPQLSSVTSPWWLTFATVRVFIPGNQQMPQKQGLLFFF